MGGNPSQEDPSSALSLCHPPSHLLSPPSITALIFSRPPPSSSFPLLHLFPVSLDWALCIDLSRYFSLLSFQSGGFYPHLEELLMQSTATKSPPPPPLFSLSFSTHPPTHPSTPDACPCVCVSGCICFLHVHAFVLHITVLFGAGGEYKASL